MSAADRRDFDTHVAGCAECQRDFERFTATVSLLRSLDPARAPAGFVDRVMRATTRGPWYQRLLERVFLPLPVKLPVEAAAIVLVAVGVAYVFQATPELQRAARVVTVPRPAPVTAPSTTDEASRAATPPTASKPTPVTPSSTPAVTPPTAPPSTAAQSAPAATTSPERQQSRRPAEERDARRLDEAKLMTPAPRAPQPTPPGPPSPTAEAPAPAASQPGIDAPGAPAAKSAADQSRRDLLKSAPAPEPLGAMRRERSKESSAATAQSAPAQIPPEVAARAVDVSGRLEVSDRAEAGRALASLATRHGGTQVGQRDEAEATVVDLVVPRAGYPEFSKGLPSIGRWSLEREPADLPEQVRISVRVTPRS